VHGTIEQLFAVEWRPLAGLDGIARQWRALAERALAPNVFYEPAFALAAAPVFGNDIGCGLVWGRAAPARLLGLFPARIERRRYGILPALVGWTHPFAPLGTPLIDRDAGAAVVSAWLDLVATSPDLPKLMLMPYLPVDGPVGQAFDAALAQRHGNCVSFNRHRRALLAPPQSRAHYLDDALGGKKRKELRRQRRRLADGGALVSRTAVAPADVAAALDEFLKLEAAGWKGRAGTAARADASVHAFMRNAVLGLAQEGKARIARLSAGGRPIAAIVTLTSGANAWCWKIAYDESFARFSPGVLLTLALTEELLEDAAVAHADSCATADHPMIDHVWRERLALCDRLIAVRPQAPFARARYLEAVRSLAIAQAKSLRDRLRR
jgi:CelD/BcsL family acetyltransferase involved in cellulose biosynthesis